VRRFLGAQLPGRAQGADLGPAHHDALPVDLMTRAVAVLLRHRYSLFTARSVPAEEIRTVLRSGEIDSSLFGAADAAGIPDRVIGALADIFAGEIDFYHDVQRGDRFSVVYEMRYVDGEVAGSGRILAAEFVNDVDSELQKTAWVQCGSAHGYYRDVGAGGNKKVILAIPRHNSRIWHDLRSPRTEDFAVTRKPDAAPAPQREMEMLSI